MLNKVWKMYNATEDDCIEYNRCIEMLKNAGMPGKELDERALCCNVCFLSGRCPVIGEGIFLGARTC